MRTMLLRRFTPGASARPVAEAFVRATAHAYEAYRNRREYDWRRPEQRLRVTRHALDRYWRATFAPKRLWRLPADIVRWCADSRDPRVSRQELAALGVPTALAKLITGAVSNNTYAACRHVLFLFPRLLTCVCVCVWTPQGRHGGGGPWRHATSLAF